MESVNPISFTLPITFGRSWPPHGREFHFLNQLKEDGKVIPLWLKEEDERVDGLARMFFISLDRILQEEGTIFFEGTRIAYRGKFKVRGSIHPQSRDGEATFTPLPTAAS